ncbi:hypothetical protein CR513_31169, partial [Mucuna pruriens]
MTHALQWYVEICNYLVASTYLQGASKATRTNLEAKQSSTYGMTLYSKVRDQVGPPLLSYDSQRRPLQINKDSLKDPRLGYIGPPYSMMHIPLS